MIQPGAVTETGHGPGRASPADLPSACPFELTPGSSPYRRLCRKISHHRGQPQTRSQRVDTTGRCRSAGKPGRVTLNVLTGTGWHRRARAR